MLRGFWERDSSSIPIDCGVPFLEPGHSENDLGFSKIEYHDVEVF